MYIRFCIFVKNEVPLLKQPPLKLAIVCDDILKGEFLTKEVSGDVDTCFFPLLQDVPADADAVMDLLFENSPERISRLQQFLPRPVFINALVDTLTGLGQPFIRINAWPTFLKREITELVAFPAQEPLIKALFEKMTWAYLLVPDKAGMVSARIIAGIINEAYYALEEQVSSREEIDIAMKIGTNYPFGPFEWSRLIGVEKIFTFLSKSSEAGNEWIAPLLASEALPERIK